MHHLRALVNRITNQYTSSYYSKMFTKTPSVHFTSVLQVEKQITTTFVK